METINSKNTPWGMLHVRNICYVLMGAVLLLYPDRASGLHTGLLGSLLVVAGLSMALLGVRMRQLKQSADLWLILGSMRDIIFGVTLLVQLDESLVTILGTLGFWALVFAFLQSVEAMYYFLGTRSNKSTGYWIEITHFSCVLVAGGFAFVLVLHPDSKQPSLGYVGLFLIGLGLLLFLLTQRLRQINE